MSKSQQNYQNKILNKISFKKKFFNKNKKLIKKCFDNYGVVIINNFFDSKKSELFKNYIKDINLITKKIKKQKKLTKFSLTQIRKKNPEVIGFLCDLGSKPNNFISGLQLKLDPYILRIVKFILNTNNLGTMNSSDRLILESNLKYEKKFFQDIHNDYDYVHQSKAALTASLNLKGKIGQGGINVYLGSHKKKFKVSRDKNKRPQLSKKDLKLLEYNYEKIFIPHMPGSIIFFHTLLFHCTVQNKSDDLRATQIFRYSDLNKIEYK